MSDGFVFPNDLHPAWSIMIVLYPYITGLVAGAFVVSALYHVFHRHALQPVARLALVTSLCFCSCATLPLLLHLHRPERCFNVLITPSPTSAIAGFGFIYSAYMLILCIEVWLEFRPDLVRYGNGQPGLAGWCYRLATLGVHEVTPRAYALDRNVIQWLSLLGIPVACLLHGYVGFLFGAIKANPWWSTALMPVIFLTSAIVSGMAALLLLYLFMTLRRREEVDLACLRSLSSYLWMFLILAVTLEGLEILQLSYEGTGEWPILASLMKTRLKVSHGLIQNTWGAGVPLLLLPVVQLSRWSQAPRVVKATIGAAALGACLVLVQVAAMRWNVVVGGQMFSKSFRGFVDFPVTWLGREGLFMAGFVLVLPLAMLYFASRSLPIMTQSSIDPQSSDTCV